MGSARITFLLALGASLWGAAGTVEVDAPRPQSEASASVTVTAEALPVELAQTPNAVLVLDKAAIEASGATSVSDLLQDALPGQVFNNGGVGTAASIYLGGARAQDTVVTLDGLRLTDVSGLGGMNTSALQMAGIERIEVQQGPCSTRFGSDALGGAVALYSAGSAPAGLSGELRGAAGNEGIRRGGGTAAYGWERGWVRVAVTAQKEDEVLDPSNPYRSVGTFLGLGRQLGADTLLTVNYFNSYSGVPIPIVYTNYDTVPRSASTYDAGREDFSRTEILSGTLRTQFSPVLSGEVTLGQVLQQRLEPDVNTNLPTVPYLSRRNQAVGHVTWQPSSVGSLTVGLDGYEETARCPDLSGADQLTATGRHLAVVLDGQRELLPGVRAVASLRTERDRVSVPTLDAGSGESSTTQSTGKLGLNWTLPDGFRVYGNAGTGFSNPLLYNSIFNYNYGGAALDNEKSRSAQLGVDYGSGPWSAGVAVSRTLFSNMVYYDSNGGVPVAAWGGYDSGIYRNGQQVRTQMAVFKAGYATGVWGLDGFYRNQETRDLQAPAGEELSSAAAISRSPFQTLGAHAFRVLGAFRLEGRWSWIGPRYDAVLPTGMGYHEHFNDLSLWTVWSARPDLTVTLRGEHLMQPRTTLSQWLDRSRDFQNDAEQIYGYPAQPPTVTLEVRYRL
jgi:outer membrane cobalamin receptor